MNYSYLNNSNLDALVTNIVSVSEDEGDTYLVFEDTVFHPKGGGQLSDVGYVEIGNRRFEVSKALSIGSEIRHYVPEKIQCRSEHSVVLTIDLESRRINSRLHSAGHLLDYVLTEMEPEWKCIKGHHYPGEAYLEFNEYMEPSDKDSWCQLVQSRVNEVIKEGMEVKVWEESGYRSVQFGEYQAEGCGGTHVKNIKEIGEIIIKKVKIKKDRAKLSYNVGC